MFPKNRSDLLVEDIESLRKFLKLKKINLWGNSWGSTLVFLYAQKYYKNIKNLLVSGIFLGTIDEDCWMFNTLEMFFPNEQKVFADIVPNATSFQDIAKGYVAIMEGNDESLKKKATAAFNSLEEVGVEIIESQEDYEKLSSSKEEVSIDAVKRSEIFFGYQKNHYFLPNDFLSHDKMKPIDENLNVTIMNGRYDIIVTTFGAFKLKELLPNAKLVIVEGAGHRTKNNPKYVAAIKNYMESR